MCFDEVLRFWGCEIVAAFLLPPSRAAAPRGARVQLRQQHARALRGGDAAARNGAHGRHTSIRFNPSVSSLGLTDHSSLLVPPLTAQGHALHSALSRTEFQHLSGTRGSLDFVEASRGTVCTQAKRTRQNHKGTRSHARHSLLANRKSPPADPEPRVREACVAAAGARAPQRPRDDGRAPPQGSGGGDLRRAAPPLRDEPAGAGAVGCAGPAPPLRQTAGEPRGAAGRGGRAVGAPLRGAPRARGGMARDVQPRGGVRELLLQLRVRALRNGGAVGASAR